MEWKLAALAIVALSATVTVIFVYATIRWKSGTEALRARLDAARRAIGTSKFDVSELTGLPAPVQRYFRAVLRNGQQIVVSVNVEHNGTFNSSQNDERWRPFVSSQRVVTQRPGFDWDARIAMMPGVTVRVHDAYVAGDGLLHATLFGLVPLADLRGTQAIAQGELMRFFAESAWYPTALLPSQGVQWEAVDDTSAIGTLMDANNEATLLFRFNEHDLIESARAKARGAMVGKDVVMMPWEGSWSNYQLRDGMIVPLTGEVPWVWCGPRGVKRTGAEPTRR
jgi:hypothetical protein